MALNRIMWFNGGDRMWVEGRDGEGWRGKREG